MSEKDRKAAQIAAIQWLIGQCEDQMVRGWLIQEREFIKSEGVVIR